ncbi:hypothetical protein ACF0H5_005478 [Mactra antiquata]
MLLQFSEIKVIASLSAYSPLLCNAVLRISNNTGGIRDGIFLMRILEYRSVSVFCKDVHETGSIFFKKSERDRDKETERERERERERQRQRDRETETERERLRESQRETNRQSENGDWRK